MGIHIPEGAVSTERFIPFYPEFPLQPILESWLKVSAIRSGPLFRGFFKGERLRDNAITLKGIEDIFYSYPLEINGQITSIKPFDLRRYYAQMMHNLDYELDTIAENLGVRRETVVGYIGTPSPRTTYTPSFDLSHFPY